MWNQQLFHWSNKKSEAASRTVQCGNYGNLMSQISWKYRTFLLKKLQKSWFDGKILSVIVFYSTFLHCVYWNIKYASNFTDFSTFCTNVFDIAFYLVSSTYILFPPSGSFSGIVQINFSFDLLKFSMIQSFFSSFLSTFGLHRQCSQLFATKYGQ